MSVRAASSFWGWTVSWYEKRKGTEKKKGKEREVRGDKEREKKERKT